MNLIANFSIVFDTNDQSNLAQTVPVIGMENMVTHVCLCYTCYLMPGNGHLIKPAATDKLMSFPAQIHASMS